MPIDVPTLLIGLAAAAIPLFALLWQQQRRLAQARSLNALLDERLSTSQLAQATAHFIQINNKSYELVV